MSDTRRRRTLVRVLAAAFAGFIVLIALWLGLAFAIYPSSYVVRVLTLRESRAEYYLDYFPTRALSASLSPARLPEAPDRDLVETEIEAAFAVDDAGAFLGETDTHAFIVIRDGEIIYEAYPGGGDRSTMVTSFSVAKSVTSMLIGVAIDEGHIGSVDDPVTAYLPELEERDPAFAEITIRDLLNMSSGLDYQEMRWFLFNGDDPLTTYHPDQRAISLENTSIVRPPGEVFSYNKYHPQLLGMILERTTGVSVSEWTQTKLWDPAGMEYDGAWTLDSEESGFEKMEAGLNARAIDFAKIGLVFLNDGEFNGSSIVSREWVDSSIGEDHADRAPAFDPRISYGFMWWIIEDDGAHAYYAAGDHGQYIFVNPTTEVVIVRNGPRYGIPFEEWTRGLLKLSTSLST
jgi:CubicO group peptidase (beta-lactamase class C family)